MFEAQGVIAALVTPLTEQGEVIESGLREVIDYTIDGGVHGVFALGSSGEIYGLSDAQKRQVLEITVDHVAGRVPIYAGASEITTPDCLKTVQLAHDVGGVTALSVLTPYFMTPTQSELITHFRTIAEATDLPVLLYSNPNRTNVPVTVDTVVTLAETPNIVGIKDSTGNIALTSEYINNVPDDFAVLIGLDTVILPGLMMGARGAIASTANIAPKLVSGIYDNFKAGNIDEAKRLQTALAELRKTVNVATFPVVIKEALNMLGINAGYCLAPARELSEANRTLLKGVVDRAMAATN